jgi:hypothetical protein
MKPLIIILFVFSSSIASFAQEINATKINEIRTDTFQRLLPFDTTRARVEQMEDKKAAQKVSDSIMVTQGVPFKNVLRYDFYGTAAAVSLINKPDKTEKGNFQLYYNATINNRLNIDKFSWSFFLFNEYGYKKYFDSLGIKNEDGYNLRNTVQWALYKKKLKLNANVNIKSQIWRTYQYNVTDSTTEKILYSAYFSPGYVMYSGGLAFITNDNIAFELGMVSGKTTKIKNQEIFDDRKSKKLYGLDKGEKKKVDYGLTFIITAPIVELRKNIYWETNSVFFSKNKSLKSLNEYTMDVNSAFHFLFWKYLRLSLRTKIIYDKEVQDQVFMSNQISFGFYLSNKMK